MPRKKTTEIVLDLVNSGDYDIVQQINNGEEEMYEGCSHNLYIVLVSGEAKVQKLKDTDPRARKGHNTYTIEYSSFIGNVLLTIWEL